MATLSKSKKAPAKKALKARTPAEKKARKKDCGDCEHTKDNGSPNAAAVVEKMLGAIEAKIQGDQIKPTVGDYLRLLQYRDEKQHSDQPREIKVTWVESEGNKSEREK